MFSEHRLVCQMLLVSTGPRASLIHPLTLPGVVNRSSRLITILLSRFLLNIGALRHSSNTLILDTPRDVMSTQFTYGPSDMPSAVNPSDRFAIDLWRSEVLRMDRGETSQS